MTGHDGLLSSFHGSELRTGFVTATPLGVLPHGVLVESLRSAGEGHDVCRGAAERCRFVAMLTRRQGAVSMTLI